MLRSRRTTGYFNTQNGTHTPTGSQPAPWVPVQEYDSGPLMGFLGLLAVLVGVIGVVWFLSSTTWCDKRCQAREDTRVLQEAETGLCGTKCQNRLDDKQAVELLTKEFDARTRREELKRRLDIREKQADADAANERERIRLAAETAKQRAALEAAEIARERVIYMPTPGRTRVITTESRSTSSGSVRSGRVPSGYATPLPAGRCRFDPDGPKAGEIGWRGSDGRCHDSPQSGYRTASY